MATSTIEEYRNACLGVAYLAGCAVNGMKPDPERIGGIKDLLNSGLLFKAAERHMLTSAVASALASAGI